MVILDRDGVINQIIGDGVTTVDGCDPIAGSIEAIGRLDKAGYLVTIAGNHSGISRGSYTDDEPISMNEKMQRMLAARGAGVDGIFYCPHDPEANCNCRRPKPGLLFRTASEFDIALSQTPLIGDDIDDIRAARLAQAQSVLVRTGHGEYVMQNNPQALGASVYDDPSCFARATLRRK